MHERIKIYANTIYKKRSLIPHKFERDVFKLELRRTNRNLGSDIFGTFLYEHVKNAAGENTQSAVRCLNAAPLTGSYTFLYRFPIPFYFEAAVGLTWKAATHELIVSHSPGVTRMRMKAQKKDVCHCRRNPLAK